MSVFKEESTINGIPLSIETGNWAKQAHGSIVYRSEKLVLLATVCAEKEAKEGQDFFPLTVDYREKFYAVGRVPGGYFKRENRPAEHETLISRLIDRPIRPLFPDGYFSEVQLLVTVLSADPNSTIEGHAITAASAAIAASDIPFHGPIAGVVVGRVDGKFIADPPVDVLKTSDLELTVAGSATAITMIEGGAHEYSNQEIIDAVTFAHEEIKKKVEIQNKLAAKIGLPKRQMSLRLPDAEIKSRMHDLVWEKLKVASRNADKAARSTEVEKVFKEAAETIKTEAVAKDPDRDLSSVSKEIKHNLEELEYLVVRDAIFNERVRADGRKLDEIRDISVELDVLPSVHGSAVFTRGQTQSLGVVTLGTASDFQRFENLSGQQQKHFMLHYNFPPFSTGEVKRMSGPGRREIGHGNLAERALKAMVPGQESFPYVIRVVSEILESNGSSSMASVCSGSLAMMCAGIPLERPIAGIAMGLIMGEDGKYAILSDIAGLEDHFGDMDFKVAGTEKGITAFQLDIKIQGLTIEILKAALEQAEKGRFHILGKMNEAISASRASVPSNAPRIMSIQIDPERIGELIGPGGKIIRAIIEKSGAEINVEDTGIVTIASVSEASCEAAKRMINDIFAEVEVGAVYDGTVKKIADFGAFIEISPGKEGLLHISKIDSSRVHSVRDFLNEGDKVQVMVIGVDRQGRIDLSRKDLLAPKSQEGAPEGQEGHERRPHSPSHGHGDHRKRDDHHRGGHGHSGGGHSGGGHSGRGGGDRGRPRH